SLHESALEDLRHREGGGHDTQVMLMQPLWTASARMYRTTGSSCRRACAHLPKSIAMCGLTGMRHVSWAALTCRKRLKSPAFVCQAKSGIKGRQQPTRAFRGWSAAGIDFDQAAQ